MTFSYGDRLRIADMQTYEAWFRSLPANQSGNANIEFNGNPLKVVQESHSVGSETCVFVEWEYNPPHQTLVHCAWIPVRFLEIDPNWRKPLVVSFECAFSELQEQLQQALTGKYADRVKVTIQEVRA